jgi:hypothetical protein
MSLFDSAIVGMGVAPTPDTEIIMIGAPTGGSIQVAVLKYAQ